jgi:crotonobetainyl-CoA:carnitine CoA-transferase CaiB-like acyl-CoA transferase
VHRDTLELEIEEAFGTLPRAEITARLEAADIPVGDINEVSAFLDHPQLAARHRWRDVASPVGALKGIVPPMDLEGMEPRMGRIPEAGEHTDEILAELGYDDGAIRDMRHVGTI